MRVTRKVQAHEPQETGRSRPSFYAAENVSPTMPHDVEAMLVDRVHSTLERFDMIRSGERVLVGVSGGADSVALAHVLTELAPIFGISLVLAHLNHGLRDAADGDAAFCRGLARHLGHRFVEARANVAASARENGRSIEHEGRVARYGFFEREAARLGCERIAVGHTLDDQAETFLLRLMRGSGTKGLGSIHPVVDGQRIRPLIEVRRRDVEAYLEAHGIAHRDDVSNRDRRFARNRLRHEVLPRLREAFNPRLEQTLAATSSILRDEEAWMEEQAARAFGRIGRRDAGGIVLHVPSLAAVHPALRRRIVRRALEEAREGLSGLGRVHVEDVLGLAGPGRSGRELHVPGARACRSFDELLIRSVGGPGRRRPPDRGYNAFEHRLSIPGRIRVSERGGTLVARAASVASLTSLTDLARPGCGAGALPAMGDHVVIGVDKEMQARFGLVLRSSRPGDRFRPLGGPGSKPLTRYLMEQKVARSERESFPVLCGRGPRSSGPGEEILWVVGFGVSESARLLEGREPLELGWRRG